MVVFLDSSYVVLKLVIHQRQVLCTDYHYYLEEVEDRPEEGNRKWWSSGGAFTAINNAAAGIFGFSNTLGYTTASEPMIKGSLHDHSTRIIIERLIVFITHRLLATRRMLQLIFLSVVDHLQTQRILLVVMVFSQELLQQMTHMVIRLVLRTELSLIIIDFGM